MTKQSLCETNSTLVIKFTALVLYFTYNTWLIVRFDWGIIYCSINEGLVGSVTVEVGDKWILSLVLLSRKDWWQQREIFTPNSQGISIQFALKWWRIYMQMNDGEGWMDLGDWWRSSWCLVLSLKHSKWPFSWGMASLYTKGIICPVLHSEGHLCLVSILRRASFLPSFHRKDSVDVSMWTSHSPSK